MRFYYYNNNVWCDENYFDHVYEFTSYWKWFYGREEQKTAYTKISPTGIEILKCPIKVICKLKLRK